MNSNVKADNKAPNYDWTSGCTSGVRSTPDCYKRAVFRADIQTNGHNKVTDKKEFQKLLVKKKKNRQSCVVGKDNQGSYEQLSSLGKGKKTRNMETVTEEAYITLLS